MRERKYIKFRVDMCEDTKFKIIDMKPERDVIHYVWTRLVLLVGKVNCEGELYMSKNIPYTIETLAIEFNRNTDQIKLALDVFMELEMIEVNEDNVYIVKNFAKHQNIKVKEKIKSNEKEKKNEEVNIIKNQNTEEQSETDDSKDKDKKSEKKVNQSQVESDGNNLDKDKLDTHKKDTAKVDKNIINYKDSTNSENKTPISLEKNKRKKTKTNKKKELDIDVNEEALEDNRLFLVYESDEDKPLEEGESVVSAWAF